MRKVYDILNQIHTQEPVEKMNFSEAETAACMERVVQDLHRSERGISGGQRRPA